MFDLIFYKSFWLIRRLNRKHPKATPKAVQGGIAALAYTIVFSIVGFYIIVLNLPDSDFKFFVECFFDVVSLKSLIIIIAFPVVIGLDLLYKCRNRWMEVARRHKRYGKRFYTWVAIILFSWPWVALALIITSALLRINR